MARFARGLNPIVAGTGALLAPATEPFSTSHDFATIGTGAGYRGVYEYQGTAAWTEGLTVRWINAFTAPRPTDIATSPTLAFSIWTTRWQ